MELNAKQTGDKPAIVFEGETITWEQLNVRAGAASRLFVEELGQDQQKIVALLMTNSIDFVITYLAVLKAGHMAQPIDPAYKRLEIDAIIEQLNPELVITTPRYENKIGYQRAKMILYSNLPTAGQAADNAIRLPAEKQIATLTFTSGTSGRPKAVPNTHANHIWNIQACSQVWDWTAKDTLLLNLPLSHMHGLVIGLSGAIYHGNTIYLHQQAFDTKVMMKELASGKISFFTHGPIAYSKLLEEPGEHDLSKVRVFISGSAPLAPATWQQFKDRFGVEIVETYGTSETGRIAGNRLGRKVLGSPGPPMPGVKVKLSDNNELLVKSPGVFPGYYDNPEATDASLASDGWWRTGDMAELKDGNIFLKGRVQERIRRYGYTVFPRDVEWAMRQHPDVSDIFVMGRQAPEQANDELIYFIVTNLSDEQIAGYAKENLLFAWRPDKIIRLDKLPRTSNGKASLTKLKQLAGVGA